MIFFDAGDITGSLNIRNLPDDIQAALRVRAARNRRSTEAKVRAIIEAAVMPKIPIRLGSLLAAIGGVDLDISRDPAPAAPASFD
jgi:plasmid stability protein